MLLFGKKATLAGLHAEIIAASGDAIVAVNRARNIIVYNNAAAEMFGYAPHEILGRPLQQILPEFQPAHVGGSIQIHGIRKGGASLVAVAEAVHMKSGGFALVLHRNITTGESEEQLMRIVASDPLTGITNRREFMIIAAKEAARANRYARPLSVLMLDIDHFKRINDSYGHAAGDAALQGFAQSCRNMLRSVDILARWSGEEFVALLPETAIEGASVIGERLRKITSETPIEANGNKINVTISVGVAQFRPGEVSLDGPIGRAESAAFDAKKAGRNQISIYRN